MGFAIDSHLITFAAKRVRQPFMRPLSPMNDKVFLFFFLLAVVFGGWIGVELFGGVGGAIIGVLAGMAAVGKFLK